jgi:hypothetical protein
MIYICRFWLGLGGIRPMALTTGLNTSNYMERRIIRIYSHYSFGFVPPCNYSPIIRV